MEQNRLIEIDIHRLDCVAREIEAEYGIGNPLDWMPADFKTKWYAQMEKLDAAVKEGEVTIVSLLVDGCIRAWHLMAENAKQYKKAEPEFFEVKLESGFHLRIAKSVSESRMVVEKGVVVWSLEEIARVIENNFHLVNVAKDLFPEAKVVELIPPAKFDFKTGDEIPF